MNADTSTQQQPNADAPQAPAVNLADRAMLIDLTIGKWQTTARDKAISAKVETDMSSQAGAGSYVKKLLAPQAYAAVTSIYNEITSYHKAHTVPWSDKGMRLKSSIGYVEYMAKFRNDFTPRWQEAVADFLRLYPSHREAAKVFQGNAWKADDYPPAHKMPDKFKLSVTVLPVPQAGHFLVDFGQAELAAISAQLQAQQQTALAAITTDILRDRMLPKIKHMIERLTTFDATLAGTINQDKTDGRAGAFRDSLITNIEELLLLIPELNIGRDATVNRFALDMTDLLKYEPDTLRDSDTARNEVLTRANEIAAAMAQFV